MALSDIAIRSAKPESKAYKLTDAAGLFLLVTPNGGKWWRLKYYYLGKEKQLSLGTYPEISLAEAREKRAAAKKLLSMDPPVDPSQDRKQSRAETSKRVASTLEVWGNKWWDHWRVGKSERHADQVKRRLEADIYPALGSRPMHEITTYDIVDVIKAIGERGAIESASRGMQNLGQIFRYALIHAKGSKATRNPVADIKPSDILPSVAKSNYARIEAKELPKFLRALDSSKSTPLTRLAVKLLALTFVRTKELIEAEWAEFDITNAQWRIPSERMKMKDPHIVPLSRQALEVLEQIRLFSGHSIYVFPGQTRKTTTMSNNTILKAIEVIGYKGQMTGHGFRGLASTVLHEQGFDHQHIELQLAHLNRDEVSAAYNHALYLAPRANMMQQWADYLDKQRIS